jgi:peptide/nickel transport system permease protein
MTIVAETAPESTPIVPARRSRRPIRLPRSPKILIGVVILVLFAIMALIGPWVAPFDPTQAGPFPELHPSGSHWLGTTQLGQDIWSQLLVSARNTLVVGFVAGTIATALSVVVGVTAGYVGGITDELLSMLSNVFLVIPGLPLLIVLISYLPAGAQTNSLVIGLVISFTGFAWGARVLRAQTLSIRSRDYVEAARIVGERRSRIIFSEILPNLIALVASSYVFTVLYAIGTYVALSFLGLATNTWNWGTMLFYAVQNNAPLIGSWWWYVPPGVCIALVGTALVLVNFGIDEFINPRLRAAGVSARRSKVRVPKDVRRPKLGLTPVVRDVEEAAR